MVFKDAFDNYQDFEEMFKSYVLAAIELASLVARSDDNAPCLREASVVILDNERIISLLTSSCTAMRVQNNAPDLVINRDAGAIRYNAVGYFFRASVSFLSLIHI